MVSDHRVSTCHRPGHHDVCGGGWCRRSSSPSASGSRTVLHINNSLHNIVTAMTDDVIGHTTFATPTTVD